MAECDRHQHSDQGQRRYSTDTQQQLNQTHTDTHSQREHGVHQSTRRVCREECGTFLGLDTKKPSQYKARPYILKGPKAANLQQGLYKPTLQLDTSSFF